MSRDEYNTALCYFTPENEADKAVLLYIRLRVVQNMICGIGFVNGGGSGGGTLKTQEWKTWHQNPPSTCGSRQCNWL